MNIYITESLCSRAEIDTTLKINYTSKILKYRSPQLIISVRSRTIHSSDWKRGHRGSSGMLVISWGFVVAIVLS